MGKDALTPADSTRTTQVLLRRFGTSALLVTAAVSMMGATYRTPNFIVTAPTAEIAEQVGKTAEFFRDELAVEWLGKKMPRWYKPCTVSVKVGQIGAGGATTFAFDQGQVFGWRMEVQGSLERILDSVVPHEVNHTIMACHFRRPLPRWADEGAATLVEHESEQRRQRLTLEEIWNTSRRIPLRKLLSIKEYPKDPRDVLTLYAEGYSLADLLVQAGGKTRYLKFLDTAHESGWDAAIKRHYSLKGVDELETRWRGWIMAGSPRLNIPEGSQVASADRSTSQPAGGSDFSAPVIRSQNPREARNNEGNNDVNRNWVADNETPSAVANTDNNREMFGSALRSGHSAAPAFQPDEQGMELPLGQSITSAAMPAEPFNADTVARPEQREVDPRDLTESPGWQRAVHEGWSPAANRSNAVTMPVPRFAEPALSRNVPVNNSQPQTGRPLQIDAPPFERTTSHAPAVNQAPADDAIPAVHLVPADREDAVKSLPVVKLSTNAATSVNTRTTEDQAAVENRPPVWSAFPPMQTVGDPDYRGQVFKLLSF